jgi:hypothetical protein
MDIFALSALTLVASVIGTVSGFGLSTIMIPVLVLFYSPIEAIYVTAIVHWFGDVWKVVIFPRAVRWRLFVPFAVAGLVAAVIGATFTVDVRHDLLLRLLGAFLLAYAVFLFTHHTLHIRSRRTTALVGGGLSGLAAGMFGVGGPIRSVFISAFNLPKASYIATLGAIGIVVDVARVATYAGSGVQLSGRLWWSLVVLVPISFLGAELAKKIVTKISQRMFRVFIAVLVLVVGVKLLIWG